MIRQGEWAGVSRATVYAQKTPRPVEGLDLLHRRLRDEEYARHPFYGTRRRVVFLSKAGHPVNRKRVQRLMREMGRAGRAPGPNTRRKHPEHKVYPYLLRGVPMVRPHPVWRTDITTLRLAHGFVYRVAIIDGYSRRVLSGRISKSMEAVFCVDGLEDALRLHGQPEIFNSDQGAPFTRAAFTGVLEREKSVLSREGRGRVLDNIFVERLWRNVKYEDVYLKGYATIGEWMRGLTPYFVFYNGERPHQARGDRTLDGVYRTAQGGGAIILDKFLRAAEEPPVPRRSTDGSSAAGTESTATATTQSKAKPGQRRSAANAVKCTA